MNITSSLRNNPVVKTPRKEESPERSPQPNVESYFADPQDGWFGASLSVAGGVTAMTGALTGRPLLTAGGALLTAAGTGLTAHRVQQNKAMDSAAWVSFVGGGALTTASALVLMGPSATQAPSGPLPQLIERLGLHGL